MATDKKQGRMLAGTGRWMLAAVALWLGCVAAAQTGQERARPSADWQEWVQQWEEQSEGELSAEELMERLSFFAAHPINVNDTGCNDLLQLPFVTPVLMQRLKAYIEVNGALWSVAELVSVNGFDSALVCLLMPFVRVGEEEPKGVEGSTLFRGGKGDVVLGTRRRVELPRGYRDGSYFGSPYRFYFRAAYQFGKHIHLQLSGDKDPGEPFLRGEQQAGFDFYGGHLMLRDMGRLRTFVVGQYSLQYGQGLTLWSGFAPWSGYSALLWRNARGLGPASALAEYGYLQGVAGVVEMARRVDATVFYSIKHRDATLAEGVDGTWQAISLSETGYHRTLSEQGRRRTLGEQLAGMHLDYKGNRLSVGLTAYGLQFDTEVNPTRYRYNPHAFAGRTTGVAGADATYVWGSTLLFGEVAWSAGGGHAALAGVQSYLSSDSRLSVAVRDYSPDYQNFYASAWGQGSAVSNQRGVAASGSTRLPGQVEAFLSAELFAFPDVKYRVYEPSHGTDFKMQLTKNFGYGWEVQLRGRSKSEGRNFAVGGDYVVEQIYRRQLHAQLSWMFGPQWRLRGRLSQVWFGGELSEPQQGRLLQVDVSGQLRPVRLTTCVARFDVTAYDARVYLSGSDFLYESSLYALNHRGWLSYVLLRWDVGKRVEADVRYGLTWYTDVDATGSGPSAVDSPLQQEVKARLRVRL